MPEPARPSQQEYWNSKVGEEWASHADRMDRMLQPMTAPTFELLALQPGESVLDIGCGAGATSLAAARQVGPGGRVVGVDLSRQLLARARERAEASAANVEFLEAEVGLTPIAGAPFDGAFSRFGVMFFNEPAAAFAQIREAMAPDGRLVFICWRSFEENVWSHAPLTALTPLLKTPVSPPDPDAPGPFAFADNSRVNRILGAAGWRDIAIAPWNGDVLVGGGGDAHEAAEFLLRIGPCARAIADQKLDVPAARRTLAEFLAERQLPDGVALPAACWIVSARA
ncbi:MAG: methyltransferase domain-containing protein [Hyphomonadaceae bacterium]